MSPRRTSFKNKTKLLTVNTGHNLQKLLRRIPKNQVEPIKNNSVSFLGHATLAVKLGGRTIITDPVLYNRIGYIRKNTPLALSSIPLKYDFVLITHFHMDHLHYPSLKLLDKSATIIMPKGATRRLRKLGFKQIIELDPHDSFEAGDLKIKPYVCNHDGRRYSSTNRGKKCFTFGYLIKNQRHRIFVAGDTAFTNNFDDLKCDIAFMPIGCYTPVELESKHCNPEQSYQMFQRMRAQIFVPIHFGTLEIAMDNENLTLQRIQTLMYNDERIKILTIGQNYPLHKLITGARPHVGTNQAQ